MPVGQACTLSKWLSKPGGRVLVPMALGDEGLGWGPCALLVTVSRAVTASAEPANYVIGKLR